MHKVAKLIVSFKRLTASSDKAMILDLSTLTFSKDISEQDWPSTVENELIDMPLVFESKITRHSLLSVSDYTNSQRVSN